MKNEEYWNMRAGTYDEEGLEEYEAAYRKTIEKSLAYIREGDKVLEIACGTGIVTIPLAEHAGHVTAIDISSEMIKKLREKAGEGHPRLTLMHTDIFEHILDGETFDLIAAFNVLLYMENIDEVLGRIRSLLKPGGIFLSATDCVGGIDNADSREKKRRVDEGELSFVGFYTPKQLEEIIASAGFEIIESENLHTDTPNQFIAAVRL